MNDSETMDSPQMVFIRDVFAPTKKSCHGSTMSIEGRLALLRSAIDRYYFHIDVSKPLAAVAFNPLQSLGWCNYKYRLMEEFISYEVYKNTGISLDAFMHMPMDEVTFILSKLKLEVDVQADLRKLMEAEIKKGKDAKELNLADLEYQARSIARMRVMNNM